MQVIEAGLTDAQDTLARLALTRKAQAFDTLIGGSAGVGGIYDLWRRLKAFLNGKRFVPEHTLHAKSGRASPIGSGMDATAQTASPTTRTVSARLPLWVLTGAFLGILAGITFGERASLLKPLGDVYAMMLLSVVYPYILSSLIVALGSLAAGRARHWGRDTACSRTS